MQPAARQGDIMSGTVPHHAGHVIRWEDDGDGGTYPVYCSGHDVTGTVRAGSPNVFINGLSAARGDDIGPSTDPCDGSDFQIVQGSGTVFINGKVAARQGDLTYLYPGEGKLTTGSPNVFIGG